jgi:hypothetical protein
VKSTGAISASTSLAPGTYTVGGTDSDTAGDTGTWSFMLVVSSPLVTLTPYTECAKPDLTVPSGYYVSNITDSAACSLVASLAWTLTPVPKSGPYTECAAGTLTVPSGYYVSNITDSAACATGHVVAWTLTPV